jgi:hypothetical protein
VTRCQSPKSRLACGRLGGAATPGTGRQLPDRPDISQQHSTHSRSFSLERINGRRTQAALPRCEVVNAAGRTTASCAPCTRFSLSCAPFSVLPLKWNRWKNSYVFHPHSWSDDSVIHSYSQRPRTSCHLRVTKEKISSLSDTKVINGMSTEQETSDESDRGDRFSYLLIWWSSIPRRLEWIEREISLFLPQSPPILPRSPCHQINSQGWWAMRKNGLLTTSLQTPRIHIRLDDNCSIPLSLSLPTQQLYTHQMVQQEKYIAVAVTLLLLTGKHTLMDGCTCTSWGLLSIRDQMREFLHQSPYTTPYFKL